MVEIDGRGLSHWATNATEMDLSLLLGGEFSDDDNIWTIVGAGLKGISISSDEKPNVVERPYIFFTQGTFFLDEKNGLPLKQLIEGSLSVSERRLAEASDKLRSLGFSVADFGGATVALFMSDLLINFDEHGTAPDQAQWERVHEILGNGTTSLMKTGANFVEKWIAASEKSNGGLYDLYRRVLLAVIYRRTGQYEKALRVSEVVDFTQDRLMGGSSNIAVLCTTRAASMMDLAESETSQRVELLRKARLALNKAFAISGGESKEVLEAYRRLKKMDNLERA